MSYCSGSPDEDDSVFAEATTGTTAIKTSVVVNAMASRQKAEKRRWFDAIVREPGPLLFIGQPLRASLEKRRVDSDAPS